MTDANYAKFSNRLRQIDRKHRLAAHGYVQLVERDGILVPKATRKSNRRGFPLRGLMLTLLVFLVFKGFLLAQIGPITYGERIGKLAEGSVIEQIGAWVMSADPMTLMIAEQLGRLI